MANNRSGVQIACSKLQVGMEPNRLSGLDNKILENDINVNLLLVYVLFLIYIARVNIALTVAELSMFKVNHTGKMRNALYVTCAAYKESNCLIDWLIHWFIDWLIP